MPNPYYEVTVPVFKRMLASLDHLLTKGLAYAVEHGISEETMLGNRLAPDMFPLARQIQIATDNAKGAAARFCGIEPPVYEDTETSVAQLRERISKTVAFLDSLSPEQFKDAQAQAIKLRYYPEQHFDAYDYLTQYALPNFFFHVNVAYALLRAMGADIGKSDYLGPLSLQPD